MWYNIRNFSKSSLELKKEEYIDLELRRKGESMNHLRRRLRNPIQRKLKLEEELQRMLSLTVVRKKKNELETIFIGEIPK